MTFLNAAYEMLKQAGHPLYHAEITRRALEQGLIQTAGKTPEATMSARLLISVREGEESPFVRVAPRVYVLAETFNDAGLLAQVEE